MQEALESTSQIKNIKTKEHSVYFSDSKLY